MENCTNIVIDFSQRLDFSLQHFRPPGQLLSFIGDIQAARVNLKGQVHPELAPIYSVEALHPVADVSASFICQDRTGGNCRLEVSSAEPLDEYEVKVWACPDPD